MIHLPISAELKTILEKIPDPEIPVLTVLDLGVIRKAETDPSGKVKILLTPTYSGCPAMGVIENDIREQLELNGYREIDIQMVYAPAWTTDWISEEAREKLRQYGIAPPEGSADKNYLKAGYAPQVKCPRCGSPDSKMISQFGSTACKALYSCNSCKEPFDYFKCL